MRPFHFKLFAASMFRTSLVAPWILTFSFPLGAVVALQRRRRALDAAAAAAAPAAPTQPLDATPAGLATAAPVAASGGADDGR